MIDWLPPLVGSIKLNFNGCSLGNPGQISIGGVIRDHSSKALRAYSKHAEEGLGIKAEILALLEGFL